MSLQKKQVFNMPAFIDAVTQLIKDGYTINKHHTRATYGGYYSIAYEKLEGEDKSSVAEQATIEADKATDTLELMSVVISSEQQVELDEELQSISREDELKALTIKELREILKSRDVPFAPAAKEAKLIELILGSE